MRFEWRNAIRRDPSPKVNTQRKLIHPSTTDLQADVNLVFQQESALAYPCFLIQYQNLESHSVHVSLNSLDIIMILTEGEREAVRLAIEGLGNKEIAERLGRSEQAIKLRLHTAFKKLNVQNRVQLANLFK